MELVEITSERECKRSSTEAWSNQKISGTQREISGEGAAYVLEFPSHKHQKLTFVYGS